MTTTLILNNSPMYEKTKKKKEIATINNTRQQKKGSSQKEIKLFEHPNSSNYSNTSNTSNISNTTFTKVKNFSSKDDLLMESLTEFFTHKRNLNQMLPIVTKRANISLRILDWFVTNYAKRTTRLCTLLMIKYSMSL